MAKRGRPPLVEAHKAKRPLAVSLLARGYSQSHTARELKISGAKIAEWMSEPDFAAAVAAESEEQGSRTRAEFMDLRADAVKCLKQEMAAGGAAGVRAAIEVLRVTGITNVPVIPPRINDLYQGKTIEVRFVSPEELPQRSTDSAATAGGSGDDAASPQS